MRGLILCYSTTGNTRLVAGRIRGALQENGMEAVVRDPVREPSFDDFDSFDLVGFGAPTMSWKPSLGFFEMAGLVPRQERPTPSFVFCTSGGQPVNTLRTMAGVLSGKGFVVLDGLEVTAENNWPVARQFGGMGCGPKGKPDETALQAVGPFAAGLVEKLEAGTIRPKPFPFLRSPLHYIGKGAGPRELRRIMGLKRVAKDRCIQCAECARSCAARAISLKPYPVFSHRCMGCWSCYNNCPTEAITTSVTGGRGRYPGPLLIR